MIIYTDDNSAFNIFGNNPNLHISCAVHQNGFVDINPTARPFDAQYSVRFNTMREAVMFIERNLLTGLMYVVDSYEVIMFTQGKFTQLCEGSVSRNIKDILTSND